MASIIWWPNQRIRGWGPRKHGTEKILVDPIPWAGSIQLSRDKPRKKELNAFLCILKCIWYLYYKPNLIILIYLPGSMNHNLGCSADLKAMKAEIFVLQVEFSFIFFALWGKSGEKGATEVIVIWKQSLWITLIFLALVLNYAYPLVSLWYLGLESMQRPTVQEEVVNALNIFLQSSCFMYSVIFFLGSLQGCNSFSHLNAI